MSTSTPNPSTWREKWSAFTRFVRLAWRLSTPYFQSEERWRARGLFAAIVVLNLAAVYMLVLMNDWNRLFYDSLQNKQADVFWAQLLRFTYLAFAYIVIAVYKFYLTQLLEMRWRRWMTSNYLQRWLAGHAFYRLELARYAAAAPTADGQARNEGRPADNPDQRIQEDLNLFTSHSISLSMGLLNAVVTLVSFVGILWGLSGGFAFDWGGTSFNIPGFMVWMAVLYCIAGSVAAHYIGRSQIALNFEQQRVEADFRHNMVRVREYSESIALDKGEPVVQGQLDLRFGRVLSNYLLLLRARKRLIWFTTFFGQAAVVFPFVVAAPRFFSGAIQLGELMQIASAFGRVQDSLSWFVDNYSALASWRATTDRLTGFAAALDEHPAPTLARQQTTDNDHLTGERLSVGLPDGRPLLAPFDLALSAGERVIIRGPSGSGKSTLLRVLAGIWPHANGALALPSDFEQEAMFVPQRPYLPHGRLRDALSYPDVADRFSDEQLRAALVQANLKALGARLDDEDAWQHRLSGGEQQRLALARVFLRRPRWLFADEATSALDGPTESQIYERLKVLVQERHGAMVSVAHRPAVDQYHDRAWNIQKQDPPGDAAAGAAPFFLHRPA